MALTASEKMTKARANLIMQHPFFGTLALRLVLEEDPKCKTASVDGTVIRFNPDFVNSLSGPKISGLVASLVMHIAMLHHTRRGARDPAKWNKACDHAIASIIDEAKFELPNPQSLNKAWDGYTAEHIYSLLPDEPDDKNGQQPCIGSGDGGGAPDPNGNGGVDDSPNSQNKGASASQERAEEAEWKTTVAQAAHAAKQRGMCPASIERMVGDLLAPTIDWKETLRRFMTEKAPDDFSWARPNRRFIAGGLYLPSMSSENTGEVVVCVDTSGSIGEKELREFGGEISAILTELKPTKVHVIYCDAAVNKVVTFGKFDDVKLEAVGGGGTDFRPPFTWLEQNGIEPKCLVYLTDGYGPFPEEHTVPFPTLWAINNFDVTPPWGEHLTIQV